MFKNPIIKNILSALIVSASGFILWNITFLVDFLFQSIIRGIFGLFVKVGPDSTLYWYPITMHGLFVVFIGLISWPILRSKMRVLFKAIYLTVPLVVVLVTLGIFFYRWPPVPYILGGLFTIGILYYLYRTKKHWLYYFAVLFTSLVLLIAALTGVEI